MSNYVRVEHSWDDLAIVECRMCEWWTYRVPEFAHDEARNHVRQCRGVQAAMDLSRPATEPPC